MNTPDPIMTQLRERRISLGLRQSDVAEMVGHHTQHLGQLERGTCSPALRTARKVAEALGYDLTLTLMDGAVAPQPHVCPPAPSESLLALQARTARQDAANEQLQSRITDLLATVEGLREENQVLRQRFVRRDATWQRGRDATAQAVRDAAAARRELGRARTALEALARQPHLTHDLIDRALRAVADCPRNSAAA